MKTKKTIVAATVAALAVPGTALATGPGHDHHDGDRGGSAESRGDRGDRGDRGKHRGHRHDHDRGDKGDRGWRGERWFKHGRKAFVVSGTDVSGLSVADGALAGPITLDPQIVSRGAAKLLNLTKEQVRGEDTITFGAAGDAVEVKYKGLTAADALQPTDRVTVFGKVRDGVLDVKHVKVWRAASTPAPQPAPAPPAPQQHQAK